MGEKNLVTEEHRVQIHMIEINTNRIVVISNTNKCIYRVSSLFGN